MLVAGGIATCSAFDNALGTPAFTPAPLLSQALIPLHVPLPQLLAVPRKPLARQPLAGEKPYVQQEPWQLVEWCCLLPVLTQAGAVT